MVGINIRVYALFVKFGEECSNIAQEIAAVVETVHNFCDFCNALVIQDL